MDNSSEDWERQKRIKTEKEKASRENLTEDKANLANTDVSLFMVKKGFTRNPEAHRTMSEKLSGLSLAVIILGVILDALLTFLWTHLHMGIADTIPMYIESIVYLLLVIVPLFVTFIAAAETIAYYVKMKKIIWSSVLGIAITIALFVAYQKIRLLIAGI